MKTLQLYEEDLTDEDSTPAPSFNLEAFRKFLTRKLRDALDALLEWGDGATKVLAVSAEKLQRLKKQIAVYFYDYKRMFMPLNY